MQLAFHVHALVRLVFGMGTPSLPQVTTPSPSLRGLCAPVYFMQDFMKMNLSVEGFYTRNVYRRIRDCWNRPIASTPGAYFDVVDRVSDDNNWTFRYVTWRRRVWQPHQVDTALVVDGV